ncbi:HAD family hydrolase [Cohnella ginsengisoli]|uniref:HAD family hydrolase n=1 Tax=Cohnella ginsengisoli TaxID=425004 RepID=A0A9X4KGZ4_9BACL|nr:HAD family hydrolase [Cohnella ginsengisoli]MDG0789902.1 HAD family hydrolase [Cohnella ginsengisoli]
MKNIQAVLFDLDNTLLDRTRTFQNFTSSFVRTYFSHDPKTDSIAARIIELDQDGYKEKTLLFTELLQELPWLTKPELNELMDYYSEHYVKNALLMEHAVETMSYIRRKYKLGLITNGRTAIQYGKIDRLGIRDNFNFILVSEEAGVKKPDNRIFKMASDKLGVSPEQCLYIGDHPKNDIEGAGLAGMKTIWFEVNQPWRAEITVKPEFRIKHLIELENILKL